MATKRKSKAKSSKDEAYDIGRRLAWARGQIGFSQGTVARLAGIAPSYLSRVENGKVQPTFRTVQRIARSLKADLRDIVGTGKHGPTPGEGCPISRSGTCMLDLVRTDARLDRLVNREAYSPREMRLLQLLARWMEAVSDDRLKAMEMLFTDLAESAVDQGKKTRRKSNPA